MKVAGALAIVIGAIITALLWIMPTSFAVFGTTVNCGMPLVTSILTTVYAPQGDELETAIGRACRNQSYQRVVAGFATGATGLIGGGVMLLVPTPRRRGAYS